MPLRTSFGGGSAGSSALPAAFSTTAPTPVGNRAGVFSARSSIYLPSGYGMRKTRLAMAKARGGTGSCKIACIGDSETSGYGGTRGVNDWPLALRQSMSEPNFPVGTGIMTMYDNYGGNGAVTDTKILAMPAQWTYTGSQSGGGNLFFHRQSSTSQANPVIYKSDAAGTVVEIFYFENGGGFQYQLDSGAFTGKSTLGSNIIGTLTVSGLAMQSHQVAIQPLTSTTCYILGVNVKPAFSVDVSNFGFWGAKTADWLDLGTFYDLQSVAVAYAPTLSIIQLGVNDAINSVSIATYKANMQTIINNQVAAGSEIALICSYQPGGVSVGTWDTYRSAMYDLSDTNAAPLLDLTHRSLGYTQANSDGLMSDITHPNGTAYTDAGFAARQLIYAGAGILGSSIGL